MPTAPSGRRLPPGRAIVPSHLDDYQEQPHFAQIVKQSAAAIGVDINLTIESGAKYFGDAVFGSSDWLDGEMSLSGYGARSVPNVFLEAPLQTINAKTGQGAWNAARFNDPAYDKLVTEFVAAPDLSTQRRLAGDIERLLLEETPIIYAYFCDMLFPTQKNITGLYPTATQQLFFWNVVKT
jgi:peptide/nickel transport system substrate-binding protein